MEVLNLLATDKEIIEMSNVTTEGWLTALSTEDLSHPLMSNKMLEAPVSLGLAYTDLWEEQVRDICQEFPSHRLRRVLILPYVSCCVISGESFLAPVSSVSGGNSHFS